MSTVDIDGTLEDMIKSNEEQSKIISNTISSVKESLDNLNQTMIAINKSIKYLKTGIIIDD